MAYQPSQKCLALVRAAATGLRESDILAAFAEVNTIRENMRGTGLETGGGARANRIIAEKAQRTRIAAAQKSREIGLRILARDKLDAHIDAIVRGGMTEGADFALSSVRAAKPD